MDFDQALIDQLVLSPRESLIHEVKRWIDSSAPAGIAKIVRAALALRNRNGGYLIIGFDDATLKPDIGHAPADVRMVFHADIIQALVSKFASELFEVGVGFGRRDGQEYPVIVIPEGVRTMVATKADLTDAGKPLVRYGEVYFRTLAAKRDG
jgi:hypothetical protein